MMEPHLFFQHNDQNRPWCITMLLWIYMKVFHWLVGRWCGGDRFSFDSNMTASDCVSVCPDRNFVSWDAGTLFERPWRHCPVFWRSILSKYTNNDCLCVEVVGRSVLVPELSPGAGTADVLRWRTDEDDDVCLRPANSKKIRDFYDESHHVHSLSSKCYTYEIWEAGHCWVSRTRYRFTWWPPWCFVR